MAWAHSRLAACSGSTDVINATGYQGVTDLDLLMLCFQAPALFVLKLTIPVVDYSFPRHNWNKHLSLVHCIATPVFCIFSISQEGSSMMLLIGLVMNIDEIRQKRCPK